MKGRNNNMPFIKSSFTEDDYLKSNNNINNNIKPNNSNLMNDISITVQDNENNIKINEKEIKEVYKYIFNFKKLGNLIIISEDEKEIKYIIGPFFPLLFILNLSANIFILFAGYKNIPKIFRTIGTIMNLFQIYLFFVTSTKNPGVPSKEYEKLVYEEENKSAKNFRKCKDCKMWINTDEKTIHCRKCGICIEGYDHHCDCINICVGKKNIKNFYLLVLISFLVIVYAILITLGFK